MRSLGKTRCFSDTYQIGLTEVLKRKTVKAGMANLMKQLLLISLLLFSGNLVSAAAQKAAVSPVSLIESDYKAGRIDIDTWALLQIQTIKSPDSLPDRYKLELPESGSFADRSATLILLEIKRNWDLFSPQTQLALSTAIPRLPADFSFASPGGFFRLHYNDTGVNAVPLTDANFNTIPDFVENCAAYLDSSYDKHVLLGYMEPPSDDTAGGDDLYDIYFENTGYYGYVVNESNGPQPWNDVVSFMVLNSDFLGFPPNNDPEGQVAGAAKATAAHEYHHAVQFAYDITESRWFLESDATHMEDIVFDATDDNYNYLSLFFGSPQVALTDSSDHAYSAFVWEMFMVEKFDTSLIRGLWEGARYDQIFTVMSDTLLGRYGWSLDSAFSEFTRWNICTGIRADAVHFSEAAEYPAAMIGRSHSIYPVSLQNSPTSPAGYGASYISLYPGVAAGTLHLNFNGNDSRDWSAWIVKSTSDDSHEFEQITLDPTTKQGTLEVANFHDYYRVILIGANISEFSAPASFSYSATVTIPYGVTAIAVTSDSAVYSGGERQFQVSATNEAPVTDILSIVAWDDSGWVPLDTTSESLMPGEDTVFTFDVVPPQGTPLGSMSNLHYKVWSWGDPSKAEYGDLVAKTVLQRGDNNFSGGVDISDLTYMVDYLFVGGGAPLPIAEAGDLDCSLDVKISDLTSFVEYLFNGGPYPPCNPY